ncbi:hypothetical protein CAPTEDRAFT_224359 [Capitella teleta]|uniref:3'-5' exonuclease domain-containing protein n=1 Tax=Capitella teleta TaxID=283909 RepID=R7THR5_CAPTE|nr:hypothetical protein CAPTEDRAFT_224359 [Capitella teleta]|eukprot:ELT93333.1 hypothetical protein CAPTEDRAFT_224359 [Capitella teleta]
MGRRPTKGMGQVLRQSREMAKIRIINRVDSCVKVVQKLLKSNTVLSLSIKHIEIHPWDIVLIAVGERNGNVFIFDVKTCPAIVHEGQLWRIIIADALPKVMHDCRRSGSSLQRQYQLRLCNVFDTQAAFCLLMMEKQLPPRLISLRDLYEKCGDPGRRMSTSLQEADGVGGGIYWAQRPMSSHLVQSLATELRTLLPNLHENLLREIPDIADSFMNELCEMFINGDFFKRSTKSAKKRCKHITRLSDRQRTLLYATIPQGAQSLDIHQ